MDDFEAVWSIYPRKVAKAHARKMWTRLTQEQQFAVMHSLPVHVRYWRAAGRDQERIPHFGSWIGGERWEDELEMPVAKKDAPPWWTSNAGIEAKAQELGVRSRPGETHADLKARVQAAMV